MSNSRLSYPDCGEMVKFDQPIEANLLNHGIGARTKMLSKVSVDWLQQEPDVTAKDLLRRLQYKYPGRFVDGQLRTLQRRVKEWRKVMARELVYACMDQ